MQPLASVIAGAESTLGAELWICPYWISYVPFGTFLQPVYILWDGSPALQCSVCSPQHGVIYKCYEKALSYLGWVIKSRLNRAGAGQAPAGPY